MVGLCGMVGSQNHDIRAFSKELCYNGTENISTFQDDRVSVGYVRHTVDDADQPERAGDISIWIWGVVLGHERKGVYRKRPEGMTNAEYCSGLYEEFGTSFLAGLNSDFAGIIFDQENSSISIFTDRLGSRPLYYTWADDGSLVFSSQIQSLVTHPDLPVEFDPEFLSEFLQYGRCFGIYTPLKNVYQTPPASVTTFNMQGDKTEKWTYWWPNPSPQELNFSETVETFTQTFLKVVQDDVYPERDCGLLLSGGADSRAVLAASDGDVTGLHMNERMERNKEEWIARRAATIAGADFRFLERTADYYPTILESSRKISNYNGRFRHARVTAFSEAIRESVDVITSGHYGDTMAGGWHIPWDDENGEMLPVSSPKEYADSFERGEIGHSRINVTPDYVTMLPKAKDVISTHLHREGERTVFHGIPYPSWNTFIQFGMIYPITNTYSFLFYESNNQVITTRQPFHDNRILDIVLNIPVEYRCQNDIIAESLRRINDDLASIESQYNPASFTELIEENKYLDHLFNTPPKQIPTDILKYIGIMPGEISRSTTKPSYTYKDRGQRPSEDGSLRYNNFVDIELKEFKENIKRCPYIDYEEARRCYQAHLDGDDYSMELFSLLSLLETPAFESAF